MESNKCLKYDMIYLYLTGFGVFVGGDENPTELLINEVNNNKGKLFNTKYTCIKYAEVYEVNSKCVNEKFTLLQNEIEQSMQKNNDNHNNILYVIINYGLNAIANEMQIETNAVNFINEYPSKNTFNSDSNKCIIPIDASYDLKHKITSKINITMLVQTLHDINNNDKVNVIQSFDAGTYLCNYLMYKSINFSYMNDNVLATFVHIPLREVLSLDDNIMLLKKLIEAFELMYINK